MLLALLSTDSGSNVLTCFQKIYTLILLKLSTCTHCFTFCFLQVPSHNYLYKILYKLTAREKLSLENIREMLVKLLDRYDSLDNTFLDFSDERDAGQKDIMKKHFKRPYKMLLIWAVLLNRFVILEIEYSFSFFT